MKKPTPFEEAYAAHIARQEQQQREARLMNFASTIQYLRQQVEGESGIRYLGSQGDLRTGTFNS